ncbi:fungal-specific transcription factor domain-containing protein [Cristinia sonorae]|uniref:Fungal-specific transcription factor domain-containing protein n=1 Tax=Cristinia sonorae TaxID=1940300 RepID=A0A8K0UV83_9AGAR|nr:fungal-specific transcription factor domain-containing protein [Cristinia sonorae]
MPADHSKPSTSRPRRHAHPRKDVDEDKLDSTHSREIELKRSRGEISCAECRRLKIRCDKTIPCQSCQRRGCAALCPNGTLATGQGTRFVLAATEHLHKRIARMGERIRQLEDALAILQAKCTNEPHPLLTDDAPSVSTPERDDDATAPDAQESKSQQEVIEAFGTLSVYDHGVSRFFGPSGGPESRLGSQTSSNASPTSSPSMGSRSPESIRDSLSPPLSSDMVRFSASFPFSPVGPANAVLEIIEGHLPSWDRACHLSEAYIEHAAWLFRGVSKQQLLLEMLPSIYRRPLPDGAALKDDYSGPHDYALIYLIFAVGALLDLNQEPYNAEGEHYHQLARAALCLQPVLEKPSSVTIQALHLLSVYNGLAGNEVSGGETSLETTWSLVGLAAQLSHSIGLHRDSARWGLSDDIVNRRRLLFWNLFVADSWQSLTTGRPPSFSRQYMDAKFPVVEGSSDDPENDFGNWGYRFALECVSEVAALTLTAEAPSYATIMELDRKVREFPIPPEAAALLEDLKTPQDSDEPLPLSVSMTRFVLSHSREVILLSIHRAFFAQAIIDCPDNPLRSQYAPSFLAAYRASCTILKVITDQFALLPTLCARFWVIWTYAFSAAVVFGSVVTRGPRSPLAKQAVAQLEVACELFTKAAKLSRRAAKAWPILIKLKEKAQFAIAAAKTEGSYNGALWKFDPSDDADELEIFAGKTRLVESKHFTPSPPTMHAVPLSSGSEMQYQPAEALSGYEQDFKPAISPPSVPPIPTVPSAMPSQQSQPWYPPHGYPASSYSHHHQPSPQPQSPYGVHPPYEEPRAAYPEQHWQPMHGHAPHQNHLPPTHPSHHSQPPPNHSHPPPSLSHPPPHQHVPSQSQRSHHPLHGLPPLQIHQELDYATSQLPVTPTHYRPPSHPQQGQPQSHQPHQPQAGSSTYRPPSQGPSSQAPTYPVHPSFQNMQQGYMPPAEMVSLGLASRESRLDERWASFIHESGYLDGINFGGRS